MTYWTPEREQQLLKLVKSGLSALQIATKMGGVSRSAIIGKCSRKGLHLGGTTATRTSNQRRLSALNAKPRTVKPTLPPVPVVAPESKGLTLEQLERSQCRWPTGREHERYVFCGERSTYRDYCTYHARMAYRPKEV